MKRILPLFALLPSVLLAAEVSPKDAARAAKAWVDRGYAMGKLPAGLTVAGVDEVEDPATGARLLVAKFEGGGFVVLSADDLVDPVLAFSETGDGIDPDDNDPFWFLLRRDIAAREDAAGVVRGSAPVSENGEAEGFAPKTGAASGGRTANQEKWADLLSPAPKMATGQGVSSISDIRVDMLVQSRWNQSSHNGYSNSGLPCYNYYTPNNYVCGCGATAVSQVMRYFQFPTGTVQARTYSCMIDDVVTDLTMQGGTYDWSNMPLKPYQGTVTEVQRKAIGKLTSDVGIAMDMMYAEDGSGSFLACGYMALKEDFGYANVEIENSGTSDMDDFKKCLIPSFDAKSPVILGLPGHFIVADGYGYSDGDWYIHLNFGWGASYNDKCDAWYMPPNFNAETWSKVHSFSYADESVYNIFPDKTGSVLSGRVTDASGAPVSGATVSLDNGHSATTDENGIYAFVEDVASDTTFTVTAAKGGSTASVQATVGKTTSSTWSSGTYKGMTVRARSYSLYPSPECKNSYGNDIVLNVSHDTAPTISSAAAADVSFTSAKIVVAVSDLGVNSTSVEVKAVVGGTTKTQTLTAAGSATLSFTGLSAGTQYTATVTATGSNGLPATRTVTFSTAAYTAPTLGTVSSSATTTSVTLSVPVTALGNGAASVSVAATLDGTTKTATVSAVGGTAMLAFDGLVPDSSYPWSVVATGVPTGKTANASGTAATEALPSVGWFDVKWADDGYGTGTAWWNEAAERTSGGTWTIPAGDASSLGGSALALALPEGGELRFTAVSQSAGGGYVTVDGTLSPVLSSALPEVPAGALAALCFARGGYKAWNGSQWIALSGEVPASSATAWTATFDFASSPHKVRYAVGGATLSASGSDWVPLVSAQGFLRGVGYAGGGEVGNFKAVCAGGFPVPALATFAGDGVEPLVFGGTAAAPTLTVTVGNAKKDIWYAVYESQKPDGTYTFAGRAQAQRDGTLPITIDASATTKFLRIKASDAPIQPTSPLFPAAP
ncbi:MAG: C10 family peptidase [Kiritimatiellae bacterium]|nr:C10 family peptidase [Kiritimatiellia bacterium]